MFYNYLPTFFTVFFTIIGITINKTIPIIVKRTPITKQLIEQHFFTFIFYIFRQKLQQNRSLFALPCAEQ